MSLSFFDRPILNSPYDYPSRHWELDKDGQPTDVIVGHSSQPTLSTWHDADGAL